MTSAVALRASIAIRVDFPTPEPAKTPMRWPRQSGVKTSKILMPVSSRAPVRRRSKAGGGGALTSRASVPSNNGPLRSTGRPSASSTRPFHDRSGRIMSPRGLSVTRSPALTPAQVPKGSTWVPRRSTPTTSPRTSPRAPWTTQRWPTPMARSRPETVRVRPVIERTSPTILGVSTDLAREESSAKTVFMDKSAGNRILSMVSMIKPKGKSR